MSDVTVSGSGTIYLLHLQTLAAFAWVEDHVVGERQFLGDALAVEHRYVADIVAGMLEGGLELEVL